MDIGKIFSKIFGDQIVDSHSTFPESGTDGLKVNELPIPDQLSRVNHWLTAKLKTAEENGEQLAESQRSLMRSRIGPDEVTFDVGSHAAIRSSSDKLTVRSMSNFSSIKTNVCVFGGKWQYEVQLQGKGVMQIGWCSNKCVFTENSGVGDTAYSYGFDGSKKMKWHVSTTEYGEKWQTGDIIGVCMDMEAETIEYFRNGKSLGVAFDKIDRGPGIALFPAASMVYNEGIKGNFGNVPFQYGVPGYQPLQATKFAQFEKAELLLAYIVNIAGILSRPKYRKEKKSKDGKMSAKKTIYVLICSTLFERLSSVILDPYVIEAKLLPIVMNLCVVRSEADKDEVILPGSLESTLGTLLSLFWNYLEDDEIKFVLKKLLNVLLGKYAQNSRNFDYEKQRKVIVILNCICNHPETRKYYIENRFFKQHCLPRLMYLNPPEYSLMTELLPDDHVWTEGIGGPKESYLEACEKLSRSVEGLYGLQQNFLRTLLTNDDGTEVTRSSRKLFVCNIRQYVMDTSIEQKPFQVFLMVNSNQHNPIEAPVALSFLCILGDTVKNLFASEMPNEEVFIDSKKFFDGSLRYQHFDRLGGVLSHLRKVHHADLMKTLGSDHEVFESATDGEVVRAGGTDIDAAMFLITNNFNNISIVGRSTANTSPAVCHHGNDKGASSLSELLDIVLIYYYAVGHKHVAKIANIRDEIARLNDLIRETQAQRKEVEKHLKELQSIAGIGFNAVNNEILQDMSSHFGQRECVFGKRSIELARKQTWYRSVALGYSRRQILIWLLDKTLITLQKSSQVGPLFAFVPEIYITVLPILMDAVLDFSFHDLAEQFDVSDAQGVVKKSAIFLAEHVSDPRIILATCKDSLLQALGILSCHEAGMQALECIPLRIQKMLILTLLRPYENRAWGQSNWMLLRFWLGEGFAYADSRPPNIFQGGNEILNLGLCRSRTKNESHTGLLHNIAPASPSKYYQDLIGKMLVDDEHLSTTFLNSVLSQLNWAFSEFLLLLQEIQSTHSRRKKTFDPKQLKICTLCFELAVSLMRTLEMVISIAPKLFHDSSRPNGDLILNRVCQFINQVLSRVTTPPGSFQYCVDLCLGDLASVTHFPIMTAVLGILWALLKDEAMCEVRPSKLSRLSRPLLTDPSFQISYLEYALGDINTTAERKISIPRGNFDPLTRAHIDPLTNDVRIAAPSTSDKIEAKPPILKFSLKDFPSHVTKEEIVNITRLIDMLKMKQTLLSDITLPSENSLCPICCAKQISVTFQPCLHQSCSNCILQHLMNDKLCFYCKTPIIHVEDPDGEFIYSNSELEMLPPIPSRETHG